MRAAVATALDSQTSGPRPSFRRFTHGPSHCALPPTANVACLDGVAIGAVITGGGALDPRRSACALWISVPPLPSRNCPPVCPPTAQPMLPVESTSNASTAAGQAGRSSLTPGVDGIG